MNKAPFVYLASPYSHDDPEIVENRVQTIRAITAELTLIFGTNIVFFSPIVHSHPLEQEINPVDKPERYSEIDWIGIDKQIILRADFVCFVKIKGWEESKGMQAEREFCDKHNIPYVYASWDIARVIEACVFGEKVGKDAEVPELARVEINEKESDF